MLSTISVITATLNAGKFIGHLAEDLKSQTDQDFNWIVVDGGSTDDTVDQLPPQLKSRITLVQEKDFGIYDAINKGVAHCQSEYYLVVGSDDRLRTDAIERYRQIANISGADVVAASVKDGGGLSVSGRGMPWLRGHQAYISQHSAGTLIRKSLHDVCGLYSHSFPIAADQLFIKLAVMSGAHIHNAPEFVAGEFSRNGVSSTQFRATLFEFTLVQFKTEKNKVLQLLIFIARLIRHWKKIVR